MTISRRKFVGTTLLVTAAAISVPRTFAQSFKERDGNPGEAPPVQTDLLGNYSKASFTSYLNSIFQIQTVRGVVEVSLARVDDMPAVRGGECFSLLFRGGNVALKQDSYVIVHPALGTFQLLLVPGGSDQNGAQDYVAVINRLSLAQFANVSAPSRIKSSPAVNNSQPAAPVANPSSTSTSTSTTVSSPAQTTAPTIQKNSTNPVLPSRRKRKPVQKRVDTKAGLIN